jgi:SAM-dependent methyltransferase
LSGKKVLDLGCYQGNSLSLFIAERAESYLGVDLSRPAIDRLRAKLEARGLKHAQARAVDFLDPNFTESGFDVIYAYSVAHHFRHFELFLKVLAAKLAPGGIVVTLDPMQTSLPTRMARAAYRPFQSDRDWEWPFTKRTFAEIQRVFEIAAVQGVMGYAKWCLPVSFVSEDLATRTGRNLFARDLKEASTIGPGLWRCMQVAMCWRKRAAPPKALR